jgi:hypothetical protein
VPPLIWSRRIGRTERSDGHFHPLTPQLIIVIWLVDTLVGGAG